MTNTQMLRKMFHTSHCQGLWFILCLFAFKYASECYSIGRQSAPRCSNNNRNGSSNINRAAHKDNNNESKKKIINGNIVPKCDNEHRTKKKKKEHTVFNEGVLACAQLNVNANEIVCSSSSSAIYTSKR